MNNHFVKPLSIVIVILLLVAGIGGYIAWQQVQQAAKRQKEENAKIISETNGVSYQDMGEKTANQRSKALFGKDVDALANSDLNKELKTADQAQQAATVLAAGKQYSKASQAYQIAASRDPSGVSAYYRTYANVLDDAGDHKAATALYQQELDRLRREDPNNEMEIARIAGQIANRQAVYK